jgi:type IV pilus assembly protein PilV
MPHRARGLSLVELLVTLVLLAIGLAGLAGLQARATLVGIEAYQRTQALLLAHDMLERIRANKPDAPAFAGDDYGIGPIVACPAAAGVARERCLWSNALAGAAEQLGTLPVGTLSAGRGCVGVDASGTVSVVVAWQGLVATSPPAVDCGFAQYGDDAYRRVVVVSAMLPALVQP